MAELSDVVKSIQDLNNTVRQSAEGTATQQAKEAEAANERKQYDSEVLSTLQAINNGLSKSFGTFQQGNSKSGGLIAGLLGGLGTGLGALGTGIGKLGVGFGKGMAALGAGIAGFMLAIGGAAFVIEYAKIDGDAMKKLIQNFFGAFDEKSAGMMGGIILAAGLLAGFKVDKLQFAAAMTAIGAGFAGFFAGILLGDGIASIAGSKGIDGSALATLMTNFFSAFTPTAVALMTGMGALAVAAAKIEADPKKLAAGMTALGAGFAGFFTGILLADLIASAGSAIGIDGTSLKTLMSNFFGAFSGAGVEGTAALFAILGAGALTGLAGKGKAKDVATGMTAVGAGLAGFFTGILLADLAAGIGAAVGLNGENLKTLMSNFFGAFSGAGIEGTAVLFSILGAGALAGLAGKGKSKDIAVGMTSVGAGMAGFFTGILLADLAAKIGNAAGLNGDNIKTLINNFVTAFNGTDEAGLIAVAGLLGLGALVGIVKGPQGAAGLALGMSAVGAGLAGFFGGLMLADGFAATLGTKIDGSNLSTFMTNFLNSFSGVDETGLTALGVLLVAGAGFGIAGPAMAAKVAIGMTAMGAGLAGFFGGLMLADKFAETLGAEIPGKNLSTMMKNFFSAMSAADEKTLKSMGVLLAAGAAIGVALPGAGPAAVAVGMTALGAGLAGFFGGLMLADFAASKLGGGDAGASLATLLTNMGKGLGGFVGGLGAGFAKQFEQLSGEKLKSIGEGIKGIGEGMLAFAGGQAAGAVSGIFASIGSLFGSDSPLDKIKDFAQDTSEQDAERLVKLGKGVFGLGKGLEAFSNADPKKISGNILALTELKGMPEAQVGGTVEQSGMAVIHKGELIIPQTELLRQATELLGGSQNMATRGGSPVVINNIDNSQSNPTISNQATTVKVPDAVRSGESTFGFTAAAMMS